ncbi:MAG: GAF and ANTAR domain-containing protein [Aeromicrobium sp.]
MNVPEDGDGAWRQQYADARAQIVGEPADGMDGVVGLLHRLCRGLTADLDMWGAAVNLMSATGSDGVAAASDDRSRDADDLQFTTGEGPCHDAFASRRPVLTPDLRSVPGDRWPGYASAALSSGVGAVFAFPLFVGAVGFGVLGVYADGPGSLTSKQETVALTYAQIATEILLDGKLTTAGGELEPGLSTALDYRAEIHQAQGMVVVDLRVKPAEALARMRAHAFAHDKPLIDLARDIIGGFELPAGE